MAQVAQHWRNHLSTFLSRRDSRNDILLNPGTEYHVGLDDSHFGATLAVEEILLEPARSPFDFNLTDVTPLPVPSRRPRIILIPSPPPLPTPGMLRAATRALNPRPGSLVIRRRLLPGTVPASRRTSVSSTLSAASSTASETGTSDLAPAVRIQCSVCMSNLRLSKYPKGKISENCLHPTGTCSSCLQYSIASEHNNKMWDNISCPQCLQRLSYDEVKRHADPATFAHYDHLATRAALTKLPDFVWCTSCSSGQLHSPDSIFSSTPCPTVTCKECSAITCFNHRIPWHTGLTCSQYDRLLHPTGLFSLTALLFLSSSKDASGKAKDEKTIPKRDMLRAMKDRSNEQKASVRNIRRVCKRCPGEGCGTMIFKIDGCKHMTCLKCSHEFCWRCKRNWFYGHKCWKWWGTADY